MGSQPPGYTTPISALVDLSCTGTSERAWMVALSGLPALHVRHAVGGRSRLVVLNARDGEEVFAAGGLIAAAQALAVPVTIVVAGDGTQDGPLDDHHADVVRLGLPEGALAEHRDELGERLGGLFRQDDLVVAPYDGDGHPDHETVGLAASRAARGVGAEIWFYPVWAWHWQDPRCSVLSAAGFRVALDEFSQRAKQSAIGGDGLPRCGRDRVIPPAMTARFRRPFEVFIDAGGWAEPGSDKVVGGCPVSV